ncbi:MAG: hypothetical protein M1828_006628 [Chrysothrix sp. TS-e1954]|nr:MAG: hypothetical protein M1828_006628 [Chrysothrix sp. TS-e1954]
MSEFIGSRISLISKSDIRYVGTLHEINSDNSTVALEQVTSFGTEGRRNSPDEELPGSDSVYEYIVFRGSDVKDLRIEEPPKENKPPPPPQVPNDPAILGSGSRPTVSNGAPSRSQQPPQGPQRPNQPQFQQPPPFPYQQYNQYTQQRYGDFQGPPPPPQGFGPPGGFSGYGGMPPGREPNWYPPPGPPPGPGFAGGPGQFHPSSQIPSVERIGHDASQRPMSTQAEQRQSAPKAVPAATAVDAPKAILQRPGSQARPKEKIGSSNHPSDETSILSSSAAPPPPMASKPDVAAALATSASGKGASADAKSGKVIPAIPLASPAARTASKASMPLRPTAGNAAPQGVPKPDQAAAQAVLSQQTATTKAATAAVAAAMARLAPTNAPSQDNAEDGAMDNLTKKVIEMRTDDRARNSRHPGTGAYAAGQRGRGGPRRGNREQGKSIEVPKSDFDFESANAKFKKEDTMKNNTTEEGLNGAVDGEVHATNGTPKAEASGNDGAADATASSASLYNASSSFFDNLSSELRDREPVAEGGRKPSGQEFRSEERKRNLETFGLGSVEGGFRGGYRGRGRGRGGFRGGYGRGGSGVRGNFRGRGGMGGVGQDA